MNKLSINEYDAIHKHYEEITLNHIELLKYLTNRVLGIYLTNKLGIVGEEIFEHWRYFLEQFQEEEKETNEVMKLCKGDIKMAMKKIGDDTHKIGEMAKELLSKVPAIKESEVKKTLEYQFPGTTKNMISSLIKQAKKEIEEDEMKKVADIFPEEKVEPDMIISDKGISIKSPNGQVDINNDLTLDIRDVKGETKYSSKLTIEHPKFKIKAKSFEVEGEYNTYTIENGEITWGDLRFNSQEEIENTYSSEVEIFDVKIDDLERQIKELESRKAYLELEKAEVIEVYKLA